jgi:hypothetical protein
LGRRIGEVVGPQVVDFPISGPWVSQGKFGRQGIFCNFCEPIIGHKNAGGVCLLSFKLLWGKQIEGVSVFWRKLHGSWVMERGWGSGVVSTVLLAVNGWVTF